MPSVLKYPWPDLAGFWSQKAEFGTGALRMATVMGLQQKIGCDSIINLVRASYSLTAATTHVN